MLLPKYSEFNAAVNCLERFLARSGDYYSGYFFERHNFHTVVEIFGTKMYTFVANLTHILAILMMNKGTKFEIWY
jgi:hypothetical protein